MPERTAIYARYSSDRQNERSIEDQLTVCQRHADARGWAVMATFSDAAISGAAMANRPGLQALLAAATTGAFDLVLVEDQDRLARNLEHEAHVFNRLRHLGVTIATLATDEIKIIDVAFKGLMNEMYLVGLSQKTKRGMHANAEKGLATGARIYGYKSEPGGAIAIISAEAAVIRQIFAGYAAGATSRDLAAALNVQGVPGPKGGHWNAGTISGSRKRGNGILNTELYIGTKVWNRIDVRKDPATGKRLPHVRPESEWRRTPAPQLAIVDQATWDQVQARKARNDAEGGAVGRRAAAISRKPGIFTGLIKCGFCGASYTSYTGGRLICAGHRERGDAVCGNNRTIGRADVERRVLAGLETRLLTPEAAAAYVRAYHLEYARRTAADRDRQAPLERRIAELRRIEERTIDAVEQGRATDAMLDRMMAHNGERKRLEAELDAARAAAGPTPVVALHPRAAEHYAVIVRRLQEHLAEISADPQVDPERRALVDAARGLIIKIEVTPASPERGGPIDITLHGDLALLLAPSYPQAERPSGVRVVAGGGLEPPTCGL